MSGFYKAVVDKAEERRKKLTEHEVAEVAVPGTFIHSNQRPLTFPGGDQ